MGLGRLLVANFTPSGAIFLTAALLRPAKNCFGWSKMDLIFNSARKFQTCFKELHKKILIFVKNSIMTASKDISAAILGKVKELVKATDPEAEVILFGSRARGDAREDSDWDILILTPKAVNLKVEQTFRHKLFELELEYGQAISTFVYSKADWNGKHRATPFYHNVEEEGILI